MTDVCGNDVGQGLSSLLTAGDELGSMATSSHSHEPAFSGCAKDEGVDQGNMVCMPPHVFVFCIVLAALVSGIVVASQQIWERLREALAPVGARIHNPRYGHRRASRTLTKDFEGGALVEAAEAMDRAAAAPMERGDKVPARYVRAFCGNEKHALERWQATQRWRKDNEVDSILNEPQPFFRDIRRYFPSHISGRSRGGHIVVYEKLGDADMRTLRRELGVTVPVLLRHWIFVSEYMYRVLQPTDSAQQITVADMKGVRIQSLAGKMQEYIQTAAQLARLYYVERCHKTYIVNAPAWFGLAFRVVSPFLSARTRQKIRTLGTDLSALQDDIDPKFMPVEYGGTSTVPVSESPEERNLRRLVEAINANASANADASRNDNTSAARGVSPSRSQTTDWKTSPARSVYRSPPRNGTDKAVTAGRRKEHYTPTSTSRIRSRTNDAATVGTPRGASSASRALAPRRATWGGDGLAGLELLPVENAKRGSAMEAWRSKSEEAGDGLRGGDAEDERAVETPRRACKDAVSSSAAGDGKADLGAEAETEADVALEPFLSWEQNVAGARQPPGENWDHGDGQASEEEYIPMEDRLEAVMKDLGVPLGDEREPRERNLTPPPRETHGAGVADGGDCQLPFGALGSTGTAAAVVATRGGSTEAAGGEGGGEVITPSGRRDDGVSAGVRTTDVRNSMPGPSVEAKRDVETIT